MRRSRARLASHRVNCSGPVRPIGCDALPDNHIPSKCTTFASASNEPSPPPDRQSHEFERAYADEMKAGPSVGGLAEPEGEELFRELLDANLRLLQWHFDLPGDMDTDVQRDPDQKRPSLHGRLSFTFHAEGDRQRRLLLSYPWPRQRHRIPGAFEGGDDGVRHRQGTQVSTLVHPAPEYRRLVARRRQISSNSL